MKMFSRINLFSAGVALAASASVSCADPVSAQFDGFDSGLCDVRASFRDTITPYSPMTPRRTFSTVTAGPRQYSINGQSVESYSLDVNSRPGSGDFSFASFDSLFAGTSQLATAKADAIAALANANNGGQFEIHAKMAAFQAMIWEIVIDYDGTADSIVLEGTGSRAFMVKGVDADLFEQMKQHVLAGLDTSRRFKVLVGDGNGLESQIMFDSVTNAPMPSSSILGLVGLSTIAARRRRA